ncbi:MAG: cytochrome c [Verrucomicrobiota bacterium]
MFAILIISSRILHGFELSEKPDPGPAFQIGGAFQATSNGEIGYLTLDMMLAHKDVTTVVEPFIENGREAELTILPFKSIMKDLPLKAGYDAIIIRCRDGWINYYTEAILEKFEPFVVLLIDGEPPSSWPIDEEMRDHLFPFYIHISLLTHADFYLDREYGMMNPSAAVEFEAVKFNEFFGPLFEEPYASLREGSKAYEGRKRYLNNCMACHKGPGDVGGIKSERPFQVLKAHARYNPDFFKAYVRNPQQVNPVSKMVPHPHFDDDELQALIEFLKLGEL